MTSGHTKISVIPNVDFTVYSLIWVQAFSYQIVSFDIKIFLNTKTLKHWIFNLQNFHL